MFFQRKIHRFNPGGRGRSSESAFDGDVVRRDEGRNRLAGMRIRGQVAEVGQVRDDDRHKTARLARARAPTDRHLADPRRILNPGRVQQDLVIGVQRMRAAARDQTVAAHRGLVEEELRKARIRRSGGDVGHRGKGTPSVAGFAVRATSCAAPYQATDGSRSDGPDTGSGISSDSVSKTFGGASAGRSISASSMGSSSDPMQSR